MAQPSAQPFTCNACGRLNRADAMFCSGCLHRLPSFLASAPSVLETMTRRALGEAKARVGKPAVGPTSTGVAFPLWLPAVLLTMCAVFFAWVSSMTASGPALLQATPPSSHETSHERVPPAAPNWSSPVAAVDPVSGAAHVRDSADALTVLAPPIPDAAGTTGVKEADAMDVVAGFYRALSTGDGRAAASAVTPSKRDLPAFREERMSRFYGSLREPLAVESLRPVAANRFEAKYSYRATRTACRATATVETEVVGERTFIRRIQARC